jgi:RNA polymerase sigma-70 factor, ECF subfamily
VSEADRLRLEALFVEHAPAVHAYALRRIDAASAEETVNEVFLIAWRRLAELPEDPLPWLLACARRVLANERRAGRRRSALTERAGQEIAAQPHPGAPAIPDRALALALERLSEADRELLLLCAWDRLDAARMAATLGCSRGTLAVRLHRARRRLTAALALVEREHPEASATTMEVLG